MGAEGALAAEGALVIVEAWPQVRPCRQAWNFGVKD